MQHTNQRAHQTPHCTHRPGPKSTKVQIEQETCQENFERKLNKTKDIDKIIENVEQWSNMLENPSYTESSMHIVKLKANEKSAQLSNQRG
jgi:hypothetical protein